MPVLFKYLPNSCSLLLYMKYANIRTISFVSCRCMYRRDVARDAGYNSKAFKRLELQLFRNRNVLKGRRFATKTTLELDLKDVFPLRFQYVRTCISMWEEFPDGLLFDVGYVENDTKGVSRKPVILGLPSSVGDHMELTGVLVTLAKLGYQVVIPNLPGSLLCRGKPQRDETVFQMSVEEKTEFIKDFLKVLGIEKVDMLVTNSCSVYTGISLCVSYPEIFRSIVMINPTGLEPTKSMLPVRYHKIFTGIFEDIPRLSLMLVGCAKMFTRKKNWETINIVTYSRTIAVLSYIEEKTKCSYMMQQSTRRFAIFGDDSDRLDDESTLEYLSFLDIPPSAITVVDQHNEVVTQGVTHNGNYGMHIRGNSGDITETKTVFLRRQLLTILQSVCSDTCL